MAEHSKRDDILRAAGELIDATGYEGLSTTEVARRANVSTATLYRYFPDKNQIIRGLVFRQHEHRAERVMVYFQRLQVEPDWRGVLGELLHQMHEIRLSTPGGRSARRALFASPELQAWGLQQNERIATVMAKALCHRKSKLPADRSLRIAATVVSATVTWLDLASHHEDRAQTILADAQEMIFSYLAPYLD
jgi:AcrR family transcriptional regulator